MSVRSRLYLSVMTSTHKLRRLSYSVPKGNILPSAKSTRETKIFRKVLSSKMRIRLVTSFLDQEKLDSQAQIYH